MGSRGMRYGYRIADDFDLYDDDMKEGEENCSNVWFARTLYEFDHATDGSFVIFLQMCRKMD